jgi:hypothetical protein
MTRLLESAFEVARKLPESDQDTIAAMILEQIADDPAWDEKFAGSQDLLAKLAAKAREDITANGTIPLDDVLPPDDHSR